MAALDDDFDFEDPDNVLEDNFMELATGEVEITDEEKMSAVDKKKKRMIVHSDDEYMDEEDDKVGELNYSDTESSSGDEDGQNTRFTNYSMSSSVIRRNEQLTLLDDRFEKVCARILT